MEWLLVPAVGLLLLAWLLVRGRDAAAPDLAAVTPEAAAPTPTQGPLVRLSSFGRVPVLGTAAHQAELAVAASERGGVGSGTRTVPTRAALVLRPDAGGTPVVDVRIGSRSVGGLPPGTGYAPVLSYLAQRGVVGWCPARITHSAAGTWGAYLDAGDADVLLPRNQPDGLDLLEAHAPVPVSRAGTDQAALVRMLGPAPRACWFAELVVGRVTGGRFDGEPALEVVIDDEVVGRLTASVTQDYLRWVEPVLAAGARPGAEVILSRDSRGVQATVHLPPIAD
jgi:hypothetical protein